MCIKRIYLVSILSTLLWYRHEKNWTNYLSHNSDVSIREEGGNIYSCKEPVSKSFPIEVFILWFLQRETYLYWVLSVKCMWFTCRIKFGLENFYYIKGRATEKKGGLWRGLGKCYKLSKALCCIPQAHPLLLKLHLTAGEPLFRDTHRTKAGVLWIEVSPE